MEYRTEWYPIYKTQLHKALQIGSKSALVSNATICNWSKYPQEKPSSKVGPLNTEP